MNELIPLHSQTISDELVETVNARELHIFLGVGRDFSTWIKHRIEQYKFTEDQDFTIIQSNFPQNGGEVKVGRSPMEYYITLDMAKQLAMVKTNIYFNLTSITTPAYNKVYHSNA